MSHRHLKFNISQAHYFIPQTSSPTKLTSVVKSRILGLIHNSSLFLTCPPFPASHQVLFIFFSPLNISQFSLVSPFSLLLPLFKLPSLLTLIMLNRSSNYKSWLPCSCPLFRPEDYSKTQIW